MIFFGWENAKVITNLTSNWYCNGCDQWHETYKNAETLQNLQHENCKDILPITKNHSKMYSVACWSPPIIFIATSNYKSYVDHRALLARGHSTSISPCGVWGVRTEF